MDSTWTYKNYASSPVGSSNIATQTTQDRAAADRLAALKAIRDAQSTGGGALYANQVQALSESPETISPEMESKMYEQARVPVEAQAQAALRGIQESYYGRGIPGGASRNATEQVEIGKGGTLGNLKFNIASQRANQGRTDQMNAINASAGLANYQMGGATNLANIYSNTIAAVPDPWSGQASEADLKQARMTSGAEPLRSDYDLRHYKEAIKIWQEKQATGSVYNAG